MSHPTPLHGCVKPTWIWGTVQNLCLVLLIFPWQVNGQRGRKQLDQLGPHLTARVSGHTSQESLALSGVLVKFIAPTWEQEEVWRGTKGHLWILGSSKHPNPFWFFAGFSCHCICLSCFFFSIPFLSLLMHPPSTLFPVKCRRGRQSRLALAFQYI